MSPSSQPAPQLATFPPADVHAPLIPGVNMPDTATIRADWARQAERNVAADRTRWHELRGRGARQAAIYHARKAAHECVRCGRPVVSDAARCMSCAAQQRERQRKKGWYNRR